MDKRFFEFFKNLEKTVGTRKLRICFSVAIMNFLVLLMAREDDPKPVLPEPQNNENNKEEF